MTSKQDQDKIYISLLGLAEYFRTTNPPNIKKCIQSLQALFTFMPPTKVVARTHLQMGQVLSVYTQNVDLARYHLEQAWMLSENVQNFDDVKFDAASLIAKLYQEQNQSKMAQQVLRKALQISQHNVYWHCRLLFQLAQLHASDKEYGVASELLALGVESTDETNATYLKVLFLLSRAMILLIDRKMNDVLTIFHQASIVIENSIQNLHLKEYLKIFYLVLQVCYYLALGQVKTVKPNLKQLQQSIQSLLSPTWPPDEVIFGQNGTNNLEMFMWLPKEQLYVLVYLLTVSHSMMAGYMDKAQKFTETALEQIEKLRSQENKPILSVFHITLLEHIIMCRLIMGNNTSAIKEISLARDVCLNSPDKKLLQRHSAQLHCLLGLYAMSTSYFEQGERQLLCCIQETTERDLKLFANLNLAIIYLRTKRENDLRQILEIVSSENSQCMSSQALMGCFYYVQGLNSFHKSSFHEAKRFLRETLKMANAEDLNRLTSCSLVLLSHVFLSIGNSKESMNMVTPAMQLASKIPDINVQLWGSAILKDLYRMSQEVHQETEAYNNHVAFSQTLLADQYNCTQSREHAILLNWFNGEPPTFSDVQQQQQQQQQQTTMAMPSTSSYVQNYGGAQ